MTSPVTTSLFIIPANASSCELYTFAGPLNFNIEGSTAPVFTTDPSGARLPNKTASPPDFE